MKARNSHGRRGVVMIELAVGLLVVTVLAGATAYTLMHFNKTRAHYAQRQAAAWAADGQLQRLMAGAPLASQPPEGVLPAGMTLATRQQAGEGIWTGMTLVCVRATVAPRHAPPIVEEACGYVAGEDRP